VSLENQVNNSNLYFGLPADEVRMVYQTNLEIIKKLSNSHLLVMGGTGFVGRWLVAAIGYATEFDNSIKLSVVSRKSKDESVGFRDAPFEVDWVTADLSKICEINFENYTHVVNAATPSTASTGAVEPKYVYETIVQGNRTAIESILRATKRIRYIYLSSGAVSELEKVEVEYQINRCPVAHYSNTSSAYSHGKRVAEFEIKSKIDENLLSAQILRLFAFAGPGIALNEHFAVGNFMNDAIAGRTIEIKGNPTTVRSYMYPADLVGHILKTLVVSEIETKEVGSSQEVTMKELAEVISNQTSKVEVSSGNPAQDFSIYLPKGPQQLNQSIELEECIRRWWSWLAATRP
jgi:nucleoside-diphosphate-sugar epimerase